MEFLPSVPMRPLSQTALGALVIYGGKYAFVCTNAADPQKRFGLAELDPATSSFNHRFFSLDVDVLFIGNDFTITPTLTAGAGVGAPVANSGTNIYFDGKSAFVAIQIDGGRDWRILDLTQGVIRGGAANVMASFEHWRLSVRGPAEFSILIVEV
jgi:hypothetical protein